MKDAVWRWAQRLRRRLRRVAANWNPFVLRRDLDALYALVYRLCHDPEFQRQAD
ncbi:MAG: hypothetical protein KY476_04050 [Planctomycetes bacterium]|nr:hypothetical protein [Planctomycetota bacterium]